MVEISSHGNAGLYSGKNECPDSLDAASEIDHDYKSSFFNPM